MMTADGVVVEIGDVIWNVHGWGLVTRKKVTADTLKVWTMWRLDRTAFAHENGALVMALQRAQDRLQKAKAQVRSGTKTVAKLKERIRLTC